MFLTFLFSYEILDIFYLFRSQKTLQIKYLFLFLPILPECPKKILKENYNKNLRRKT